MSVAADAAFVASVLPLDHPLAQVARLRLDAHVRAERNLMKVQSPTPFTGVSCGVEFVDGEGESEDPSALNYFRDAGYIVDGEQRPTVLEPVVDPRDITEPIAIGARLADAADPR